MRKVPKSLPYISERICTTTDGFPSHALQSMDVSLGRAEAHIKRAKGVEPSTFTLAT